MSVVALKPLNTPPSPDGYAYYDQITFSSGGAPGRPHPGPTPPGGPVDPGYSPPWAQLPVDPGYGIPIGGNPRPPQPTPGPGYSATVIPMPPTDPVTPPPAGMHPDSKQVLIWFGPGTMPASAWVAPFASTGPVTPATPAA